MLHDTESIANITSIILTELERKPIRNNIRGGAGRGRSQTFGIVHRRRNLEPDYSRNCWNRPYLYHLLYTLGNLVCPHSFTSIAINQNFQCNAHKDKVNADDTMSTVYGFGEYTGGELVIEEGPMKGTHNIKHTPVVSDLKKNRHYVNQFSGNRISLVFFTVKHPPHIPRGKVRNIDGKYMFFRGDSTDRLPYP